MPRLYLRPDEAARAIGVSRRTLSTWQSARLIGFRRVGRTVLISVADILAAIERYRIAPVGEPKPRRQSVETGTVTTPTPAVGRNRQRANAGCNASHRSRPQSKRSPRPPTYRCHYGPLVAPPSAGTPPAWRSAQHHQSPISHRKPTRPAGQVLYPAKSRLSIFTPGALTNATDFAADLNWQKMAARVLLLASLLLGAKVTLTCKPY